MPKDAARSVLAFRRFAIIIAIGILIGCIVVLGLQILQSLNASTPVLSFPRWCSDEEWISWWKYAKFKIPAQLQPVVTFWTVGVGSSFFFAAYANYFWDIEGHKRRDAELLKWINQQISPFVQHIMLQEQENVLREKWPYPTTRQIVEWVAKLQYLFPERVNPGEHSRPRQAGDGSVDKTPDPLQMRVPHQRTFFRISYGPMLVPLVAIIATPMFLWGLSIEVNKPLYLPTILLWGVWCSIFLTYLGEQLFCKSELIGAKFAVHGALVNTFPNFDILTECAVQYSGPPLIERINLIVTVLIAILIGYVGAF